MPHDRGGFSYKRLRNAVVEEVWRACALVAVVCHTRERGISTVCVSDRQNECFRKTRVVIAAVKLW